MPSVVLAVRDAHGDDVPAAEVSIDDEPVDASLVGGEIQLDPGPHTIIVNASGDTTSLTIVARVGERRRVIDLIVGVQETEPVSKAALAPGAFEEPISPEDGATTATAEPTTDTDAGIQALAITGFTLAGVGLVAGGVSGAFALSRFVALEEQCASTGCTAAEISDGKTLAHIATTSFVVAGLGAALGVAALLWTSSDEDVASITPLVGPRFIGVRASF